MDQQRLLDFITDVESRHFRTQYDTGANRNALFVWNQLREFAGLERLTRDDLIRRYAEIDGVSYEEMAEFDKEYMRRKRGW